MQVFQKDTWNYPCALDQVWSFTELRSKGPLTYVRLESYTLLTSSMSTKWIFRTKPALHGWAVVLMQNTLLDVRLLTDTQCIWGGGVLCKANSHPVPTLSDQVIKTGDSYPWESHERIWVTCNIQSKLLVKVTHKKPHDLPHPLHQ